MRSRAFLHEALVEVRQDGRTLSSGRRARLAPGRSASLPIDWAAAVDPAGGPVEVAVRRARVAAAAPE